MAEENCKDESSHPSTTADDSSRPSAKEVFETVEVAAREELRRSSRALMFSGFAGGLGMGLTGIAVASCRAILGDSKPAEFIALLFYPIGFISVVIGRAQLFTENTLYPVALILSERRHLLSTLRLWTIVFVSNVAGATLFAFVAIRTGALHPEVANALTSLGKTAAGGDLRYVFWSGVIGGWIIALMAWMVNASHWTIGHFVVVYALTVVVGMGHFAHCIASSGEILSAVFASQLPFSHYLAWLASATSGNICGGVTLVTLLNFGQVAEEHS